MMSRLLAAAWTFLASVKYAALLTGASTGALSYATGALELLIGALIWHNQTRVLGLLLSTLVLAAFVVHGALDPAPCPHCLVYAPAPVDLRMTMTCIAAALSLLVVLSMPRNACAVKHMRKLPLVSAIILACGLLACVLFYMIPEDSAHT